MRKRTAGLAVALFIPWVSYARNYEDAIAKILSSGDSVSLALAVSNIRLPEAQADKVMREGVEENVATSIAGRLLERFGDNSGFRLLDRQTVDVVLAEYKFQSQGFTRQVDASKVGNFRNTTHLLILSIAHQSGRDFDVFSKLVTVGEARILSAEKFAVSLGKEAAPSSVVNSQRAPSNLGMKKEAAPPQAEPMKAVTIKRDPRYWQPKNEEGRYLLYTLDMRERGETPESFDDWLKNGKKNAVPVSP